jgi:hypothetical protein
MFVMFLMLRYVLSDRCDLLFYICFYEKNQKKRFDVCSGGAFGILAKRNVRHVRCDLLFYICFYEKNQKKRFDVCIGGAFGILAKRNVRYAVVTRRSGRTKRGARNGPIWGLRARSGAGLSRNQDSVRNCPHIALVHINHMTNIFIYCDRCSSRLPCGFRALVDIQL